MNLLWKRFWMLYRVGPLMEIFLEHLLYGRLYGRMPMGPGDIIRWAGFRWFASRGDLICSTTLVVPISVIFVGASVCARRTSLLLTESAVASIHLLQLTLLYWVLL